MRKLYYSPGACSLAVHIVLEEIGAPFETVKVAIKEGAHQTLDYLALRKRTLGWGPGSEQLPVRYPVHWWLPRGEMRAQTSHPEVRVGVEFLAEMKSIQITDLVLEKLSA